MLVTLDEVKTYLGIPLLNTDDDAFLTAQIALVSESVEGYCGRKFSSNEYIQTFHKEDYSQYETELALFHYPVSTVTYVNDGDVALTDVKVHFPTGHISRKYGFFYNDTVEVRYTAGYGTIPATVLHVVYSVIQGNYNKFKSGVAINFGNDVQRISISGVMSIDFDYSLDTNQRKNAFGVVLGNFMNVLDLYRSERAIVGSGTLKYVEEA